MITPRPRPAFHQPNPTNALGGVTLEPGGAPAGGGGGSSSAGRTSLSGGDAISAMNLQDLFSRGPGAVRKFLSTPAPAMPMGGGGGGGRGHGGGGGMTMGPQRPRIDGRAMPAMTTADWIAQNEAAGGHGLTPSRGGMGALPPKPAVAPTPATPAAAPSMPLPSDGKEWDDAQGWVPKPIKAMANGGVMPMGKPVIVGEKGPEMILPRADGSHFVLPHDVTAQVMPMQQPEMRADGGVMETTTMRPGALPAFATMQGDYGAGVASRYRGVPLETGTPRMVDERGMINMRQVPGAPVMPYIEDPLAGTPWGTNSGIMPNTDPNAVPQGIANAQGRLAGQRLVPAGQGTSVMVDGMPMVKADALTLMRERGAGAAASMEARRVSGDYAARDARMAEDERRRTAAQENLMAPFAGVPGMTPALALRATKNMERFIRTPQGSMWATQQGMRAGADSVTGADMLPVGDAGFVPIVRDAQGNARMAGSFIPTSRTQSRPPAEVLSTLWEIVKDPAQDEATRKSALMQHNQLTGVEVPMPRPGSKAKRYQLIPARPPYSQDDPGTPAQAFDPATGQVYDLDKVPKDQIDMGEPGPAAPTAKYNPFAK